MSSNARKGSERLGSAKGDPTLGSSASTNGETGSWPEDWFPGPRLDLLLGHTLAVLKTEHLGKRYGSQWVFKGIEIDLLPGQCLCVQGPNGSGKSTLLKVLVGLVSPTEGQVERPHRNDIGYSAIDLSLYPQLSAAEHLDLFAKFRGVETADAGTLERHGLEDAGTKLVGSFSTGMRARLKLALATFYCPKILFLDEPSAALDEEGQDLVNSTVSSQLLSGSVVIATNDVRDRKHATHELLLDL